MLNQEEVMAEETDNNIWIGENNMTNKKGSCGKGQPRVGKVGDSKSPRPLSRGRK